MITKDGVNKDDAQSSHQGISLWWERNKLVVGFCFVILLFLLVYLSPRIFYTVRAGEAGVLWRRFSGGVKLGYVASEGIKVIPPWDLLTIYDVRVQQVPVRFSALSRDALTMDVELSIRYRPKYDQLPSLHKDVGPDYVNKVVVPEVKALIRRLFGQYTAEEIYGSKRYIIQTSLQHAKIEIAERYIELDDLLIVSITLPPAYRAAIERKLEQYQVSMEYEYRIEREKLEAERKRIEAGGIRDFQNTIQLSQEYLRFKGIEATLALATSPNAKIVVIGRNEDGLPLILDTRGEGTASLPVSTRLDSSGSNAIPQSAVQPALPVADRTAAAGVETR